MATTIDRASIAVSEGFTAIRSPDRRYRRAAWSGRSYRLEPAPSLTIAVERADDCTVVREMVVGVYGAGADLREAWEDFTTALAQHLDVLERQEALSDELSRQLAYLRERVRP